MSQYHFVRVFKDSVGTTPMRYVWCRRIASSRDKLRDPNLSLAEVAFASGFQSQSHFTTLFREHFGTTPAAYRRALGSELTAS